jgi:hypothetical protein
MSPGRSSSRPVHVVAALSPSRVFIWLSDSLAGVQIQSEANRFRSPSCTQTQMQCMPEPVAEFQKLLVKTRIVPSACETDLSSSRREVVSRGANQFVRWGSLERLRRLPLARVLGCSARASGRGVQKCDARLANRGVPGGRCYLEVPVLEVSFPYILALLHVPYPYWVGTKPRYPTRIG